MLDYVKNSLWAIGYSEYWALPIPHVSNKAYIARYAFGDQGRIGRVVWMGGKWITYDELVVPGNWEQVREEDALSLYAYTFMDAEIESLSKKLSLMGVVPMFDQLQGCIMFKYRDRLGANHNRIPKQSDNLRRITWHEVYGMDRAKQCMRQCLETIC